MSKMPTKPEIAEELEKLNGQLSRVRAFSSFGDDNKAKIKAQIAVIENGWDEDDIYLEVPEAHQGDALEARAWLDGQATDGSCSESWEGICS